MNVKKAASISLAILFGTCLSTGIADACTTTIVTKGASADGRTYVTHSNDTYSSDPSIVYVPAKDHLAGSRRNVYPSAVAWDDYPEYDCVSVPRLNAPERASGYDNKDVPLTKPLGTIPEVEHTYAYLDSDYGIVNEHGLMFGECTDNSLQLEYLPPGDGAGLFYASELARVALERCRTAREAINLMGNLIDTYGLWGTGETLLVADKDEGWVMEMQPTPSGKGGLWIAQQVPDGEFFAAANQFRIRAIEPNNPKQIFNPKLIDEMKELGWTAYDEKGNLDWVASLQAAEDYHPYFAQRRVWRAMSLAAPSKKFNPRIKNYDAKDYPFSVRPDKPLTVQDLMAMHRDAYEGTEFDMTKGEAAGIFGYPYRHGKGPWQRSIHSSAAAYTWILGFGDDLPAPVAWMAVHPSKESTFVPLPVTPLPAAYTGVRRNTYDDSKLWWNGMKVTGLARGYYNNLVPFVQKAANAQEQHSVDLIEHNKNKSREEFNQLLYGNALTAVKDWQHLYQDLLVEYDGGSHLKYANGQPEADDVLVY